MLIWSHLLCWTRLAISQLAGVTGRLLVVGLEAAVRELSFQVLGYVVPHCIWDLVVQHHRCGWSATLILVMGDDSL